MMTLSETEKYLKDSDLFKIEKYGAIVHYKLLDTQYMYSGYSHRWLDKRNEQHTILHYSFQDLFIKIMEDEDISEEMKEQIIFNLNDLCKMFIRHF